MGLPNDESFSRPRDLDSVVQIEGRIKAHRWRKPSRYAMRRLRKAVDPYGKPLTLKRIFDVLDGPFGDRVGVMVLAISDAADGKRTMLATVEALRLTGLHDGLIDVLEARAIAASLTGMAVWYVAQGGLSGWLVPHDTPPPASGRFTLNVNDAGVDELAVLPGLGPATAQRVLQDGVGQ
jgi:hypothetical protein